MRSLIKTMCKSATTGSFLVAAAVFLSATGAVAAAVASTQGLRDGDNYLPMPVLLQRILQPIPDLDFTVPMLALFRLNSIPATDRRPWVVAKILPWKKNQRRGNLPHSQFLAGKVLAIVQSHHADLPNQMLLRMPMFFGWTSPPGYARMPQTEALEYHFVPGQVMVARLDASRRSFWPQWWAKEYPVASPRQCFKIPRQYASQVATGWDFYNLHRDMFNQKSQLFDQNKLLRLLTGKNIFLADEAWIVLLQRTTPKMSSAVTAPPVCSPVTEPFVLHLLPKLSQNRQAIFIYESLHQGYAGEERFPIAAVRAARRLVHTATDSSQLLPAAAACAYFLAWHTWGNKLGRQYNGYVGLAQSMFNEIQRKAAQFSTHTPADRKIAAFIKLVHLNSFAQSHLPPLPK